MRREFIINISFLILANLLIKPFYIFFVERIFQNKLGTENWGMYFTLFSLSMIPQVILDLGMTSYINKGISADRGIATTRWNETALLKFFLFFVFIFFLMILSYVNGYLRVHWKIILWIGINQFLLSFILYLRAYISGLGAFRWDSFISVSDKLSFILLFYVMIGIHGIQNIYSFMLLQSISLMIPIVLAFALILSMHIAIGQLSLAFSRIKMILSKSIPYALVFILMVLFCRIEPVWISHLHPNGPYQAGIYAASYRILDAANMMGFLFAGLLLPMFSNVLGKMNRTEYQHLFSLAFGLMSSMAIFICVPIAINHSYIMTLLYHDHDIEVLSIVILQIIPLTVNYLFSTALTASGKISSMNQLFIGSILLSFIGHLACTGKYGALGAAWVCLTVQVLTSLALAYLLNKNGILSLNPTSGKNTILIFLLTWIIALTSHRWLGQGLHALIIQSFFPLILSSVFGWIPLKSSIDLIKKRDSTVS